MSPGPASGRDPVRRPDRRHGLLVGQAGRASGIAEQARGRVEGVASSTIRQAAQKSPWLRAPSGREATQAASLSGGRHRRHPRPAASGRGGSRNARSAAASTGVARCSATAISSYGPTVDDRGRWGDDIAAVAPEVDVLAGHLPRPLLSTRPSKVVGVDAAGGGPDQPRPAFREAGRPCPLEGGESVAAGVDVDVDHIDPDAAPVGIPMLASGQRRHQPSPSRGRRWRRGSRGS